MITIEKKLDLIPQGSNPILHLKQFDYGEIQIKFLLFVNKQPYTVPSDCAVIIRGMKPDGTAYEYPCTVDGTSATVVVEEQMTIVPGTSECTVKIERNKKKVNSVNLWLVIDRDPVPNNDAISETDIPIFEQLEKSTRENAETATRKASEAASSAGASAGYANDSKTSANNAESFKNQSDGLANSAKNYADLAKDYADKIGQTAAVPSGIYTSADGYISINYGGDE